MHRAITLLASIFVLALCHAQTRFMRADDTSTLSDGDVVVIGNASHGKLLSTTEEKNRRKATPATFGPDGCPEPSGDAQLITLARLSDGWRLETGGGKCLAASKSKTQELRTVATGDKNSNTVADITVDAVTGDASVTFRGAASTCPYLRFSDTGDGFFQCYSSSRSVLPVQIYRRTTTVDGVRLAADTDADADCEANALTLEQTRGDMALTVTLLRSFTADGGWYTLCLPFVLTQADIQSVLKGAVVERLTSARRADDGSAVMCFTRTDHVSAGEPFIMKMADDVADPVFRDKTIQTGLHPVTLTLPGNADWGKVEVTLNGTFSPVELSGSAFRFMDSSGTRLATPSGGRLKPFRAYFTIDGGSAANAPDISLRLAESATGLEPVTGDKAQEEHQAYDLSGRKLSGGSGHGAALRVVKGRKMALKQKREGI